MHDMCAFLNSIENDSRCLKEEFVEFAVFLFEAEDNLLYCHIPHKQMKL